MSDQIHYSLPDLDAKIALLKAVCDDLVTHEPLRRNYRPTGESSGQVANALCLILEEYQLINDAIALLMDNSVQFFTNIRNSVTSADENAASAISE